MNKTEKFLIVLIDAEDMRHLFADWPADICLAACLERDGGCNLVVFRRDERIVFPERLVERLGLDPMDVCFVPNVKGYPTRSFLYSDERRLMLLVGSDPAILDEAIDYAVNYTYALEEGIDPAILMGFKPYQKPVAPHVPAQRRQATRAQMPDTPMAKREISPLLPDFLKRSAENSRMAKFATVRKGGFAPA